MVWLKRHYTLLLVILFIVLLNVFFYVISPEVIVGHIGIRNSYLIAFAVATLGGLSTLTGPVLFSTIVAFAAGGAEPIFLGILGGFGIFISDSIFFHIAQFGRKFVPPRWERWLAWFQKLLERYPRWFILTLVYLYLSFTILPNDILMIALVLGGYRYRHVWPVLLVGSLSIAILTAYIGAEWL